MGENKKWIFDRVFNKNVLFFLYPFCIFFIPFLVPFCIFFYLYIPFLYHFVPFLYHFVHFLFHFVFFFFIFFIPFCTFLYRLFFAKWVSNWNPERQTDELFWWSVCVFSSIFVVLDNFRTSVTALDRKFSVIKFENNCLDIWLRPNARSTHLWYNVETPFLKKKKTSLNSFYITLNF